MLTEQEIEKAFEFMPDDITHQALMDLRNLMASLETCERIYKPRHSTQTVLTMLHCYKRIIEVAERAKSDTEHCFKNDDPCESHCKHTRRLARTERDNKEERSRFPNNEYVICDKHE